MALMRLSDDPELQQVLEAAQFGQLNDGADLTPCNLSKQQLLEAFA